MLALTTYTFLKFLHVLLAVIAVGFNASYAIWLARAQKEPEHVGFALKGVKVLDDRFANPAYGLLLVTGLAMVWVGDLDLTTFWLAAGLVLYVIAVLVGAAALHADAPQPDPRVGGVRVGVARARRPLETGNADRRAPRGGRDRDRLPDGHEADAVAGSLAVPLGDSRPARARLASAQRRERRSLVGRGSEPALEREAHHRPLLVDHREPRRIAVAALHDHVPAEHPLEGEPQPERGGA